jgi:hypothetical protein
LRSYVYKRFWQPRRPDDDRRRLPSPGACTIGADLLQFRDDSVLFLYRPRIYGSVPSASSRTVIRSNAH